MGGSQAMVSSSGESQKRACRVATTSRMPRASSGVMPSFWSGQRLPTISSISSTNGRPSGPASTKYGCGTRMSRLVATSR